MTSEPGEGGEAPTCEIVRSALETRQHEVDSYCAEFRSAKAFIIKVWSDQRGTPKFVADTCDILGGYCNNIPLSQVGSALGTPRLCALVTVVGISLVTYRYPYAYRLSDTHAN